MYEYCLKNKQNFIRKRIIRNSNSNREWMSSILGLNKLAMELLVFLSIIIISVQQNKLEIHVWENFLMTFKTVFIVTKESNIVRNAIYAVCTHNLVIKFKIYNPTSVVHQTSNNVFSYQLYLILNFTWKRCFFDESLL
jgi:hypothetical protein